VEHYEATMFPDQQIRDGGEWNPELMDVRLASTSGTKADIS
jgi:hypothetical protein